MSIRIEDIAMLDFSDVADMSQGTMPPIHPGEFLSEILHELGLSQAVFARMIGVSPMRVSHVIKGTRPISAELALLLGRAFDQSPQYWMNLQTRFDLKTAESSLAAKLAAVHSLVHSPVQERH